MIQGLAFRRWVERITRPALVTVSLNLTWGPYTRRLDRINAGGTIDTHALAGSPEDARAAHRGMFTMRAKTQFRDVLDGLANTIAMGEITTDLGDNDSRTIVKNIFGGGPGGRVIQRDEPNRCQIDPAGLDPERPQFWQPGGIDGAATGRGYRWASSMMIYSGVFTIMPPNKAICGTNNGGATVMAPPSSRHQGGAHVLMGDGAVKFITDSIEAGNSSNPMVWLGGTAATNNQPGAKSPYGLWGALGTRASKEVIEEEI